MDYYRIVYAALALQIFNLILFYINYKYHEYEIHKSEVCMVVLSTLIICWALFPGFHLLAYDLGIDKNVKITTIDTTEQGRTELFNQIPKVFTEGITELVYTKKDYYILTQNAFHGDIVGVYQPVFRSIILKDANPTEYTMVMLHEVGHHVYNYKLNDDLKKRWDKLFVNETLFLNKHSSENVDEFFAEGFACFTDADIEHFLWVHNKEKNITVNIDIAFDNPCIKRMERVNPEYKDLMAESVYYVVRQKDGNNQVG